MDGRPTRADCDKAGDYVVPNVLSPRDLVFRPDNMDETVPHIYCLAIMVTRVIERSELAFFQEIMGYNKGVSVLSILVLVGLFLFKCSFVCSGTICLLGT